MLYQRQATQSKIYTARLINYLTSLTLKPRSVFSLLAFAGYMTLVKWLSLSVPQFPPYKSDTLTYSVALSGLSGSVSACKVGRPAPGDLVGTLPACSPWW